MRGKQLLAFDLAMGVLMVCGPALAHHGNAAYAGKLTVSKRVTVTKFAWANPHSLIFFDAKDAKGNVVHWVCETAAPQALRLIGWSKQSLAPGDVVTIYFYAAKNGNPAGRLQKIVLTDGTELHDTQLGGDAGGKTRYNPDANANGKT